MSTSLEDILYEDYLAEQARQEMEAAAIEGFRQDILKRYYLKNPKILQPAQKMNLTAFELHELEFYAASLVHNFSATEMLVKEIIIKPLLHGSIIDEEVASFLTSELVKKMKNHSLYARLFTNFVKSYGGLNARDYRGMNLIQELEALSVKRNEVIHHGAGVKKDESLKCIQISKLYYLLMTDIMKQLGLKVNRGSWEFELK